MRSLGWLTLALALAGCDQSRDADNRSGVVRVPLATASAAPSASPVTEASGVSPTWTGSASAHAAWFGPSNAPSLLAISCQGWEKRAGKLVVVRFAPADKGAEALFAIQGSKGILRLPVSAVKIGKQGYVWRGVLDAAHPRAEVLLGNSLKATVPGGGQLDLPPMGAAGAVVSDCVASAARPVAAQTLPNRASNPETSPADR